jgi:hypothetical protein
MCLADIQVCCIKRTIRGRRSHIIHYGLNHKNIAIDTALTQTVVWFQKKKSSQQMMVLSAVRKIYRDVTGRYPSMYDQTNRQRQTKPHHSQWLKSEYYGDRYSPITNGGLVSEEILHHIR